MDPYSSPWVNQAPFLLSTVCDVYLHSVMVHQASQFTEEHFQAAITLDT